MTAGSRSDRRRWRRPGWSEPARESGRYHDSFEVAQIIMRRLAALFLVPLACLAQAPDFAAVDRSAADELAKFRIPGAAIVIVRGDQVIYSKAYGTANIETGEPVRPEMLFRLGSTTKMFTAAALAGLAVEGKLDWSAPVGKYISGLPPKIGQVTAGQLLSHTAGIRDEAPMYGSHDDSALRAGIRAWTDQWLFTGPGRIFSYANPGYWLAGYLVEVLSGQPYADAMNERLFQPLGMKRTTLRLTMAMTWPFAPGHEQAPNGQPRIARPAADNAGTWPAGSIFSNTADLSRFAIAFLNGGRLEGKQALDPGVIALVSSPHARYPESPRSYGYGLEISEFRGIRVVEHGGSRMGYGSFIRMAPAERVAVIVVTNRSGGYLPGTIDRACEALLPLHPAEETKPPAPLPIAVEDLARHAGLYRNGAQNMEIVARDGRLFLTRGGRDIGLVKRGAARYGIESAGPAELVMVAGPDGQTEYVFIGSRALARVR
jgi:CubicO group peptidase (beta-lactamase class C family)